MRTKKGKKQEDVKTKLTKVRSERNNGGTREREKKHIDDNLMTSERENRIKQ